MIHLQDPSEWPKRNQSMHADESEADVISQTWSEKGESCPEGTIPVRRTTEEDVLRASSVRRFGRKLTRSVRRDSTGSGHEVINILRLMITFSYVSYNYVLNIYLPHNK